MRLPLRFTVRRMMVAVAVAAVVSLGLRQYRQYQLSAWLRRMNPNPVMTSRLLAKAASRGLVRLV